MSTRFKLERGPVNTGVRLRLLSPVGTYQDESLISRHGCIFVDHGLCFSVVRFERQSQVETYSDIVSLGSVEVKLLSASLLAAKSYYVTVKPYPAYSMTLSLPFKTRLSAQRTRKKLRDILLRHLKREIDAGYSFASASLHTPPALGGKQYTILQELDTMRFHCLLKHIALKDKVLIRGLGALLKANMLLGFSEFAEAAGMQLFVALEASFRLVLRELRKQGLNKPSNIDAGSFVHRAFGVETPAEGYFVEDYEKRIITLHPESRFGTWAHTPLWADDVLELNENLKKPFRVLNTQNYSELSPCPMKVSGWVVDNLPRTRTSKLHFGAGT
jgi:hypothetical protein